MICDFINLIGERKPFFIKDIENFISSAYDGEFDIFFSELLKEGKIREIIPGVYYFPSSDKRFHHLMPSIEDVIKKLYLNDFSGLRTGYWLIYKHKLTTQVSFRYEIISNNSWDDILLKEKYRVKLTVSKPPVKLTENNFHLIEFLEVLKNIDLSEYNKKTTFKIIQKHFCFDKEEKEYLLFLLSNYPKQEANNIKLFFDVFFV